MSLHEKLRLYLAEKNPAWATDAAGGRAVARWHEGGPRLLVGVPGPLLAAHVVDAYLDARRDGASLTLAHDETPTPVAMRAAMRFGVPLLDASTLLLPEAPEPMLPEAPEAAPEVEALYEHWEPAATPEPEAPPVALPVAAPVAVAAAAEPAPDFPFPPAGLLHALERPVVVPDFPLPPSAAWVRAHEAALAPPPDFPEPAEGLLRMYDRLRLPWTPPTLPDVEEALFGTLEQALPSATDLALRGDFLLPREPQAFALPGEAFFDALETPWVEPAPEPQLLLAAPEPMLFLPAPAVAEPVAEPELEPEPAVEPTPELEAWVETLPAWPTPVEEVEEPVLAWESDPAAPMPWDAPAPMPATADAAPALPWAAEAAAAAPEPAAAVTAEELQALPWNAPSADQEEDDDVELVEPAAPMPRPRALLEHPTVVAQDGRAWGLPWPRPVAPADGLSIADPKLWAARERIHAVREDLDRLGAPSFGAAPPAPGSAWLKRLQQGLGPQG